MIDITKTSYAQMEDEARKAGVNLPIEQTEVWARYQETIDGRMPIGAFIIRRDGDPIAFISLMDFATHGFHFARSAHGPAYVTPPSESEEEEVIAALADYVHHNFRAAKFLRCAIAHEIPQANVVLSTVPYDSTVVIDITGGDDAILSRMKRRGRRDVRKSLRECPATCLDETESAMKSFAEYYDVMRETGERDGFNPAPMSDYEDMIRILGPEHCRVFAARLGEKVEAWSIVTANGDTCVRYYGAMRNGAMRMHVTDKLLYSEACELGRQGFAKYDLMGIGSDFAPSLLGLNEFKTKFTEEITHVAPERDVPLHKGYYALLRLAKKIKGSKTEKEALKKNEEKAERNAKPQGNAKTQDNAKPQGKATQQANANAKPQGTADANTHGEESQTK